MGYIWITEILVNISRSSLRRGTVIKLCHMGEKKLQWTFSTHTVSIHILTRGRLCHPQELYPRGLEVGNFAISP